MVTQEMEQFLAADSPASKSLESGRNATSLPIRCQLESPLAGIPFTAPFLKLHEAVLASYWHRQVKLGDLPLDSFRMLQALEWDDPTASESIVPATLLQHPARSLQVMICKSLLEALARL